MIYESIGVSREKYTIDRFFFDNDTVFERLCDLGRSEVRYQESLERNQKNDP